MLADRVAPEYSPTQLRAVLHGVADAVVVTDPRGAVLFVNAAAEFLHGSASQPPPSCDALRRRVRERFVLETEAGGPSATSRGHGIGPSPVRRSRT